MANPWSRPDQPGVSGTKVVATIIAAWPLIEGFLREPTVAAMLPQLGNAGPYVLVGLALFYLRRAVRGTPPDLAAILSRFEVTFRERAALIDQVGALTAQLDAARGVMKVPGEPQMPRSIPIREPTGSPGGAAEPPAHA